MKLTLIVAAVLLAALAGCSTSAQRRIDARLEALCAEDGGVTIYETVSLPPASFKESGLVNFYGSGRGEYMLGEQFIYKDKHLYLLTGATAEGNRNATLTRYEIQVLRRSDGKLLAKSVSYLRVGGDFDHPGQPSWKSCSLEPPEISMLKKLFVKRDPS